SAYRRKAPSRPNTTDTDFISPIHNILMIAALTKAAIFFFGASLPADSLSKYCFRCRFAPASGKGDVGCLVDDAAMDGDRPGMSVKKKNLLQGANSCGGGVAPI